MIRLVGYPSSLSFFLLSSFAILGGCLHAFTRTCFIFFLDLLLLFFVLLLPYTFYMPCYLFGFICHLGHIP